MNTTDPVLSECPKQKLLLEGADKLSNAELLSVLIGGQEDAVASAHKVLFELGSLTAVIRASKKRLCAFRGIGRARFIMLHAVLEIVRRSLFETIRAGGVLTNPSVARDYLKLKMGNYEHEVFACMFLDSQHRVLSFEEMFRGTIDSASVHPREVVKRALHYNAAAVIFAHNHPSGSYEPSRRKHHQGTCRFA